MGMTAREIVRRTLDFAWPERVARSFRGSDLVGVSHRAKTHATGWVEVGPSRWERTDEWGNLWGRVDPTSKGEVIRGALESLDEADAYEFPDFSDPEAWAHIPAVREEHRDKWLIGYLPGFTFNIARKLRRLDAYFMDLLLEPAKVAALHDRIDEVLCEMIRNYAANDVDAVMFPEDWGTQEKLFIRPDSWRKEFFPRFRRLCGLAHDLGVRVFMHSCGQIEEIVPWLIEAGIDLLQFDQPELHGLDTLAAHQERARITFWCPVDIQTTLQTRDEHRIRTTARAMLDKLWRGRGGFIAGYYGDNPSIGLDPKWQEIACDEFIRRGVREHYLSGTAVQE